MTTGDPFVTFTDIRAISTEAEVDAYGEYGEGGGRLGCGGRTGLLGNGGTIGLKGVLAGAEAPLQYDILFRVNVVNVDLVLLV